MQGAMDRCGCLLEMEPRTLNQGKLHNAREEAMVIIQNKAPVETSNIFPQDMRSVISAKGLDQKALVHKPDHVREVVQVEESWDCSPTNSKGYFSTDPPKIIIKEPLSSPF